MKRIKLVSTGDLEFYMTILGRVNMASCWCTWCKQKMADWKKGGNTNTGKQTIKEIKRYIDKEIEGAGIVKPPIWDCIEINFFMLIEIKLVQNKSA